jgi:hypothetical protein
VFCSAVTHWESHRTHDHALLSHLSLSQPGGPGRLVYIPQEQGGPVIPRALSSPFDSSDELQGYNGGILTRHHTGQ